MTKAGDAGRGVYMTDGVMNVALLHFGDDPVVGITGDGDGDGGGGPAPFYGLYHFGMWVDDLEDAAAQVERAGAEHLRGRRPDEPNRYYEVKYRSPDGLVFDLTTSGWIGALRDPVPADASPNGGIELAPVDVSGDGGVAAVSVDVSGDGSVAAVAEAPGEAGVEPGAAGSGGG